MGDEIDRIVHCKKNFYHVYIGRPSKWGNPFSVRQHGREEAMRLYKEHILNTPELVGSLHELQNKILGCWCRPKRCHGDILLELLEELDIVEYPDAF